MTVINVIVESVHTIYRVIANTPTLMKYYQRIKQTHTLSTNHSSQAANGKMSVHPIVQLQTDIGNAATSRLITSQSQHPIQAKPLFSGLSSELNSDLRSNDAAGERMPTVVRQKMEVAFGTDFSNIRIHQGTEAPSIGAAAYTRGEHIHFAPGKYDPKSDLGQQLLGHELTHVMQQRAGKVAMSPNQDVSINTDTQLESEADKLGMKAAQGEPVQVISKGAEATNNSTQVIQCSPLKNLRYWLGRNIGLGIGASGRRGVADRNQANQVNPGFQITPALLNTAALAQQLIYTDDPNNFRMDGPLPRRYSM